MDSVRKLFTGELRGAVALLILVATVLGSAHNWMHKHITFLYGAMTTRLLSNLQLVAAWFLAVAVYYAFDSDPLLHGVGDALLGRGGGTREEGGGWRHGEKSNGCWRGGGGVGGAMKGSFAGCCLKNNALTALPLT